MTPYQYFEINTRTQSVNVNFIGSNRPFSFIEISLLYDKSDQHNTIYDTHNVEIPATKIQSLKTENASNTYSLASEIKY